VDYNDDNSQQEMPYNHDNDEIMMTTTMTATEINQSINDFIGIAAYMLDWLQ